MSSPSLRAWVGTVVLLIGLITLLNQYMNAGPSALRRTFAADGRGGGTGTTRSTWPFAASPLRSWRAPRRQSDLKPDDLRCPGRERECLRQPKEQTRPRVSRAASGHERNKTDIPQYVLDHAPLVHLNSEEEFWPCDIEEHLLHTTPHLNYTPLRARSDHPTLQDLDQLNQWDDGRFVYLKSDDNVEERPEWLGGKKNIPSFPAQEEGGDYTPPRTYQRPLAATDPESSLSNNPRRSGGRSGAPAVLIVINKPEGIVDAFWFYFYSYNLGNKVLNVRFGNHVGDWEHCLVRFQHGKPINVFLSEHFFGEAYTYDAVEKIGRRPVIYSGIGTHAMYATPGIHRYILPLGLLHDATDRGPLWDPALNSHTYTYSLSDDVLMPSNVTPTAPTEWFYFKGHWGDKIYPLSDSRQYMFAGNYHYVTGPLGPRFKRLGRTNVCGMQEESAEQCVIWDRLRDPDSFVKEWVGVGKGEGEM